MDYSSISPSGTVLAATGMGLFSGAFGQVWVLGIPLLILAGLVLVVRARFRPGKSPTEV